MEPNTFQYKFLKTVFMFAFFVCFLMQVHVTFISFIKKGTVFHQNYEHYEKMKLPMLTFCLKPHFKATPKEKEANIFDPFVTDEEIIAQTMKNKNLTDLFDEYTYAINKDFYFDSHNLDFKIKPINTYFT